MKEDLLVVLGRFKEKKILVIGDVMLDKFVYGIPTRINPEAPTLLLSYQGEEYHLGGAGNVAANVKSLGGQVKIFSFIGDDPAARILTELFEGKGIAYSFEKDSITICKERIVGDRSGKVSQIVRIDRENIYPKQFSKETLKEIQEEAARADIIIISDYAKGAITKELMRFLKSFSSKIIVDPKQFLDLYAGSFLITPNESEAINLVASMKDLDEEELTSPQEYLESSKSIAPQVPSKGLTYSDAGKFACDVIGSTILITRGPKGMSLFSKTDQFEIPTRAREVYDVSGAGDTVIATLALALAASNKNLRLSAELANYAAGIAVQKKGTYAVPFDELKEEINKRVVPAEK